MRTTGGRSAYGVVVVGLNHQSLYTIVSQTTIGITVAVEAVAFPRCRSSWAATTTSAVSGTSNSAIADIDG